MFRFILILLIVLYSFSLSFSQVDVGITGIISPPDTVFNDSTYFPSVTIQNYSLQQVTGTLLVQVDSLGSIIWSGINPLNLDSLQTDTLTFNQWVPQGSCLSDFSISFQIYITGDTNSVNDYFSKSVKVKTIDKFLDVTDILFPNNNAGGTGYGAAWGDINNDNFLDLVCIKGSTNQLFLNNGDGTFSQDLAGSMGIVGTSGVVKRATVFSDFDNDGDLDLIIGQDIFLMDNSLPNPIFTSNLVNISGLIGYTYGTSVLDIDNDSFLDIYVARRGNSNSNDLLYHNNGITQPSNQVSFIEKGLQLQTSYTSTDPREYWQRYTYTVTCADYNQDGWVDIYTGQENIFGEFNRMYRNNGIDSLGLPIPFSLVSGPNSPTTNPPQADSIGVGANDTWNSVFGDYNNDGLIDIFVSRTNQLNNNIFNILYEHQITSPYPNIPDNFLDVADIKGVEGVVSTQSWESGWADYNNDGWLDLFVGQVNFDSHLYENHGNDYASQGWLTQFTDVADLLNIPNYLNQVTGVSWADYNNDGLLDVFVGMQIGKNRLLKNQICTDNNWIQFDLVGTQSNRSAIGTQLKLYTGGMLQYRQIIGGNGRSMESLRVEFGLGQNTYIDSLVINWPSGIRQVLYGGEFLINEVMEIFESDCQVVLNSPQSQIEFLNGSIGQIDSLWVHLSNDENCGASISSVSGKFPYNSIMWSNLTNKIIEPQSTDSVLIYFLHNFPQLSTSLEIKYNNATSLEIPVYGELITSIGYENQRIPTEFSLTQNYPNPFNPTTKIEFGIPQKSKVELQIFDIKGRLVKELVNSKLNAGFYNFDWNGTDKNGSKVSSGIYFYKLKTDKFSQTKKMILLK